MRDWTNSKRSDTDYISCKLYFITSERRYEDTEDTFAASLESVEFTSIDKSGINCPIISSSLSLSAQLVPFKTFSIMHN